MVSVRTARNSLNDVIMLRHIR